MAHLAIELSEGHAIHWHRQVITQFIWTSDGLNILEAQYTDLPPKPVNPVLYTSYEAQSWFGITALPPALDRPPNSNQPSGWHRYSNLWKHFHHEKTLYSISWTQVAWDERSSGSTSKAALDDCPNRYLRYPLNYKCGTRSSQMEHMRELTKLDDHHPLPVEKQEEKLC